MEQSIQAMDAFFLANEAGLAERTLAFARERGCEAGASVWHEAWKESFAPLLRALGEAMGPRGDALQPPPSDSPSDAPLEAFAVFAVPRHMARGVSLPMFLGLLQCCRDACLDGLDGLPDGGNEPVARDALVRCFDRLDVAVCAAWEETWAESRDALKGQLRAMTREKNTYLAVFESLARPVLLLDAQGCVENGNLAALVFFGQGILPSGEGFSRRRDHRAEARKDVAPAPLPVETFAPWLLDPLRAFRAEGQAMCRFEQVLSRHGEDYSFDVTLSRMEGGEGQRSGVVVVLDDITERKRAEMRVRKEKERAEQYLEMVGSIIVVLDLSANVLLLNREGNTALGYADRELVGRNWINTVVPPELRDTVWGVFKRVVDGDAGAYPDTAEHEVMTRAGGRRLIYWKNTLLRDDGGRIKGTLSSGRDVTHQRRAETALRERDEQYRALFNNEHTPMLLIDPSSGVIVDANPATSVFYGYPLETLRSMRISDINVLSQAAVMQGMQDATGRMRNHFQFRHRLASGEIRDVEVFSGPVCVRNRTLLYSVVYDVTARVRAERERSRIYDLSADLLGVLGFDGMLREINPSWERILGWTPEELYSRPLHSFVHPADYLAMERVNGQLRRGDAVLGFEHRARCADSSFRWLSWNFMPDMETSLVYAVGRDVTARRDIDKALRESETRYRSLFEESPIALWEDDYSRAKIRLDELRAEGVEDLDAYFATHPEAVEYFLKLGRVVDVNQAAVEMLRAPGKAYLMSGSEEAYTDASYTAARQVFVALSKGEPHVRLESELRDAQGDIRRVSLMLTLAPGYEDDWGRVMLSMADITNQKLLEEKLTMLASTDSLTGACNRRQFMARSLEELVRSRRYGRAFSVLMLDLDHFKLVNDTYGHQAGDEVLQYFASSCRETFRESDIFGRLGGEEFAAVLVETPLESAARVAQRLRGIIAERGMKTRSGVVKITLSIGVAGAFDDKESLEDILHRADKGLYAAKRQGRNRVVVRSAPDAASVSDEEESA